MSVYTEVSAADLQPLLADFQAGVLLELTGIRDGIENTNYFVRTEQGEFVLTLFEILAEPEIHFTLSFMAHLVEQGLPFARPLCNREGKYLSRLHGKPTSLVTRLEGQSQLEVGPAHCQAIGQTLASMHLAGHSFRQAHNNSRGEAWRRKMQQTLRPHLGAPQQAMLDDEIAYQHHAYDQLPRGIIHSDLFRDNALFTGEQLTGLLDLYDAGHDLLLYDLAITATDWCSEPDGAFEPVRLQALLRAYHAVRPITEEEQQAWPVLLRRAALRFWLSRLYSQLYPREGHLTQEKDPLVYQQMLEYYRQHPQPWPI